MPDGDPLDPAVRDKYIESYSWKLTIDIFPRSCLFSKLVTFMQTDTELEQNKRSATRFPVALPIDVEGKPGTTRDVSIGGVYFQIDQSFEPGSEVQVSMDLLHVKPKQSVRLVCKGRVVRVERKNGSLGVAVTIDLHRFE